jgi:hypothetical protein
VGHRGAGVAGGILGADFLTWLGQAAALGIDPSRVLRADPYELAVLVAAFDHAADFARQRDDALARRVINELGEALKRGKR